MAEELDPKISRRYRELGGEEPSRELDQTILAAAHRAADRAHAPLVAPAGRHRWYFAFGAAAILVLAVAITVQLDRQQLDPEAAAPASAPSERKETFSDEKAQASSAAPQPQEEARAKRQAQPVRPKPPPSPAGDAAALQEKPQTAELARADRLEARQQQAPTVELQNAAPAAAPTPEATARPPAKVTESRAVASIAPPLGPGELLERIAELRRQGKHEEADKALEEFGKRYPDYRISEGMLKKVERPK